jgi:(R,R)-butanediol dehydrogenase/meso-butanediol dehydrogenase/diacetyl reductase
MLVFRVKACGICASDLHAAEVPMIAPGNVLGHEYAGEVVEVGEGVTGWEIGDRLIAIPGRPCGECAHCRTGDFEGCEEFVMQGFDLRMPGGYAEYSTCVAQLAIKLPTNLSDQDAATIEPLAVGLNAWKSAQASDGASVLIVGAGIIGLSIAKWARFFGAADVGISEMVPVRQERARKAGVDLVIDAGNVADPVVEYQRLTGRTPSIIFECVGRPMIDKLIAMAPRDAQLVLVGTGMQNESFTVLSAAMKRLRMTFPLAYEMEHFDFVLRMLEAGRMSTDPLVSATVALDDVPDMFELLSKPNDHCKVLITPAA